MQTFSCFSTCPRSIAEAELFDWLQCINFIYGLPRPFDSLKYAYLSWLWAKEATILLPPPLSSHHHHHFSYLLTSSVSRNEPHSHFWASDLCWNKKVFQVLKDKKKRLKLQGKKLKLQKNKAPFVHPVCLKIVFSILLQT